MVTPDELRRYLNKRVRLELSHQAPGPTAVTGHIIGLIEAADGLVVTLAPEGGESSKPLTYHYHWIKSVTSLPSS